MRPDARVAALVLADMKRSLLVLLILCSPAAADPWSAPCRTAIEVAAPDAPTLAACLPDRAGVIFSALVGVQADLAEGAGASGFVRIDKPIGKRLWAEVKARYATNGTFTGDALVGFVLKHRYGLGYASFNSNIQDSPGTRTYTVTSQRTVLRGDLVVAGGVKLGVGAPDEMTSERLTKVFGAIGLQKHGATGFGSHSVIEGFAIGGSAGFGGTLAWHNSIPPTRGVVFGMEAGYVPDTALYWAIVELGYSYEL